MKKQCVIVGLGKYGTSIAKKLADSGIEVLAIDNHMKVVEKVSSYVTTAICMDVTSQEAWDNLPINDFDIGYRKVNPSTVYITPNYTIRILPQQWFFKNFSNYVEKERNCV